MELDKADLITIRNTAEQLTIPRGLHSPQAIDEATDMLIESYRVSRTQRSQSANPKEEERQDVDRGSASRIGQSQRGPRAYGETHRRRTGKKGAEAYKNRQRTAAQARQETMAARHSKSNKQTENAMEHQQMGKTPKLSQTRGRGDPALGRSEETPASAHTHEEKANLLAEAFFPTPPADLSDITDTTFADATSKQRFEVNQSVDLAEITQIISSTGAWKARAGITSQQGS